MSMLLSGGLGVAGIGTFLVLQKRGQLGVLVRRLAARQRAGPLLKKVAAQITEVDEVLRAFYRQRPLDFFRAVLWHLVGFSVGIFQCWLFFRLLSPGTPLGTAAAACFLGMWFDLLTFAVPLNAGSQEGGRIIAFKALGYSSMLGLTFGVALRLAQLFCAGLGLALYAWQVARTRGPRHAVPAAARRLERKPLADFRLLNLPTPRLVTAKNSTRKPHTTNLTEIVCLPPQSPHTRQHPMS
jgi:hypothetical protein